MSRIARRVFVVLAALSLAAIPAFGQSTLTQSWVSSWTVGPWDYNGGVIAHAWQYYPYQPFDPALGDLIAVRIHENIFGSRELASDPLSMSIVFFSNIGWPYSNGFLIGPDGNDFTATLDDVVTNPASLLMWTSTPPDPWGAYYFDSVTYQAGHTVTAETDLTYVYTAATPEPATLLLLGTGLVGMLAAAGALKRSVV